MILIILEIVGRLDRADLRRAGLLRTGLFGLLLSVQLLNDRALAVAVLFPVEPVIDRRQQHTRFDKIAEALGGYAEYVEKPEDIRPALQRAMAEVKSGRPALVNVLTDWRARATTTAFTQYTT